MKLWEKTTTKTPKQYWCEIMNRIIDARKEKCSTWEEWNNISLEPTIIPKVTQTNAKDENSWSSLHSLHGEVRAVAAEPRFELKLFDSRASSLMFTVNLYLQG